MILRWNQRNAIVKWQTNANIIDMHPQKWNGTEHGCERERTCTCQRLHQPPAAAEGSSIAVCMKHKQSQFAYENSVCLRIFIRIRRIEYNLIWNPMKKKQICPKKKWPTSVRSKNMGEKSSWIYVLLRFVSDNKHSSLKRTIYSLFIWLHVLFMTVKTARQIEW